MTTTVENIFRKLTLAHLDEAVKIIEEAKQQMLRERKCQWSEAYPTSEHIEADIRGGCAYGLFREGHLVAYGAVMFDGEPAYAALQGRWLTEQPYVVLHRLAVVGSERGRHIGMRFVQEVEALSRSKGVCSFKADTNYDNERMQRLFEKQGFVYCGEISYPQGQRMAYEKVLG